MNTRSTTAAALFALAAAVPALAQGTSATVSLTHDDADGVIGTGQTVTWTLAIGFEGDALVAASANMELLADNALGTASDFTYTTAHADTGQGFNFGTNGGTSNGAGIGFINFGNIICVECDLFPPVSVTETNPLVVGTFDFTANNAFGTLEYSITQGQASSPLVELGLSAFLAGFAPDEILFEIDTLNIVPAPPSALLLAPVGLIATRRKRA